MRAVWPVLLLLPLAGCLDGDPESTRIEAFRATYEEEGGSRYTLVLDGPFDRLGSDLVLRPAYRLRIEPTDPDAWDAKEAQHLDGDLRLVRDEGCGVFYSTETGIVCERTSVRWLGGFLPGFEATRTGAFWPLLNHPGFVSSQQGATLTIQFDETCYEYEGGVPVPVRSCNGDLRLVSYESTALSPIPPWPNESSRPAQGPRENALFPGAELDLQGFGYTTLEAFAALRANSLEAAGKLDGDGCVVTTRFGHGSGGFGGPVLISNFETPLSYTSFTLQEADGTGRVKYTVRWVRDGLGQERFSSQVDANRPDDQGGPTCAELAAQPWPAIGVQDFLAFSRALGNPTAEDLQVSAQPEFLARGTNLHYGFMVGGDWGLQHIFLDAVQGRLVYLSLGGAKSLEPEQNG